MNPPKVRFLTKIYHPNIGELLQAEWQLTCRQARSYLPRHSEGQVVARAPDPDCAPFHPGAARRAQPRRPACERCRPGVEGGPECRHRRGQAVDPAVRQVEFSRVLYVALMYAIAAVWIVGVRGQLFIVVWKMGGRVASHSGRSSQREAALR